MQLPAQSLLGLMRKHLAFRGLGLCLGLLQLVAPPLIAVSHAQQIVTDGRTQTSLSVQGNVTDIHTQTRYGNTGVNSFSIFNVYAGNQVNLFLPSQTDNLVNMVTDQPTSIEGMLNAYRNGEIGGNVYFLNPHGVVVGKQGVVNVGRLQLVTPSFQFMDSLYGPGNVLSPVSLSAVLDNDVPVSQTGLIDIRGQINSVNGISVKAGNISVSGQVRSAQDARIAIDNLVNLAPQNNPTAIVALDRDAALESQFSALNDMIITGEIAVDGKERKDAGSLTLQAGGDIHLEAGARLSAQGSGQNSAGGSVVVMAEHTARLAAGAEINADGGTSGDGGFVEFSARDTVELAGGHLSANAQNGRSGEILIDPENILLSADLLRDGSLNGGASVLGSGTSWNAGNLTLQADNQITLADNVTLSSRSVVNASSALAHRNELSAGQSGDITLEAGIIELRSGAMITAEGNNGFAGGDISLDAASGQGAAISLSNATIRGRIISLAAEAIQSDISVYANPTGIASAGINIAGNSQISASDNLSLMARAVQEDPGYAGGILLQFDARHALADISVRDSNLTSGQTISVFSEAQMKTDLSKQGWANLAALLPIDVAVAVTESKSTIDISGTAALQAGQDIEIEAGADTLSTVYANATSLGLGQVTGVSVTDNQAQVRIGDDASLTADNLALRSRTKSQITAVGDASAAPVAGLSGSLAAAVGIVNDDTHTKVTDNASLNATGNIDILADSEVSALFAARATSDDDFSQTVTDKFDAGIDDTSQLDQEFMGFNLADFLKEQIGDVITNLTSNLSSADNETGGNKFQLGGALVFADVKNKTVAEIIADNASAQIAPSVVANGGVNVAAQGITQAQSFASGRTDNPQYGGQAGIAIQLTENQLEARIGGAQNANLLIDTGALSVKAQNRSYSGDYDNASKFGVFASSGLAGGGGGDNASGGVGIAGAIAVGINEVNQTIAEIADNASVAASGNVDVTADSEIQVKVTADGSSEAHQAADELFSIMMDEEPASETTDPEIAGGKLGIGGSLAIATLKNDTNALIRSGASFVGIDAADDITLTATQISSTETEAKSAGTGSVSLVPLAAVSVARNSAKASIEAGSILNLQGNLSVRSSQEISTSAIGNGEANIGDDGRFGLGIAAGVSVALDTNEASIYRDVNTNGGNVVIEAESYRAIEAGAKSISAVQEADEQASADETADSAPTPADNSTADNTTDMANSTEDASSGLSGMISGFTAEPDDNQASYDFSDQMSIDTDTATQGADLGSIGGDGDDEGSSKITIAAAMGVSYAGTSSVAMIADGVSINAGSGTVSVTALSNNDVHSNADASVSGGDYNIGGGVGLNIIENDNEARIGTGASVTSGNFEMTAGMLSRVREDNSTDDANQILAEATAGAGTGEFSLAGSVGLNVVVRNNTKATAMSGSVLSASGDVSISANAKNEYQSDAKATVGSDQTMWEGIDETFSTLTDLQVWTEAAQMGFEGMLENLQNSQQNDGCGADQASAQCSDNTSGAQAGNSVPAADGSADNASTADAGSEGGTGIGAGISVNIVVAENTLAAIEDNSILTGTNAGAVSVTASAESDIETNAFAGAKPDEAGGEAKTSLDAAVAVGILLKDVDAYIGIGSGLTATDDVTISANSQTNTLSAAKGEVSADSTAVGASVAVGVALESADAELRRDITTTGGVAVLANSASTDIALADAVAAGTVVDKYAERLGKLPEDFTEQTSQLGDVQNGPTSLEALKGGFTGGDGASFDLGGSDTDTGSASGGEAQQSGSLNIAASVAVNWADHAARAKIADGVQIVAGDDVTVKASNDANYRTRGSGMSVFADQSIGVGVGLLKTGQQTHAELGDNVGITINGGSGNVEIAAVTSENQGTDEDGTSFRSYASSEGIAGAGGGELGIAGALSLVVSLDSQSAMTGENVQISAPGDIDIRSTATNKIVNRAWAIAVASDVTCDNPGNCGSSGDKTAVGASIAVNVVNDQNAAKLGENSQITAGDNASVVAEDLASGAGDFTLDLQDNSNSSEDFITTNYTATLQNSSYYAEAIAGGVAQGGNAGSGSLAVTVSVGRTEAIVGEGASIFADDVDIRAYNESNARHLVGAVALSTDKKAVGASISGIYLREDVRAIVGDNGASDDNASTAITAQTGDVDITAEADQNTLTFMAAGGVSGNDLALAGAFGFNVMDTDIEARVVEDAVIQATSGSIGVRADSFTDITNVALAVSGSGGGNSVGGTLALNMFLTDKRAIVGSSETADNNISLNAAQAVNIGVNAKQEIINGIVSASVSTGSNAISGALSANVVKGESYALVNRGADINDNATLAGTATSQSVSVTAQDNTTITDLTGTIAASTSASVGVALGGNVFWKDVRAGINSEVTADQNVDVTADTAQNLTSFVVGIAGSTGGMTGAGSLGVGLIKSTTRAEIGSQADIQTSGSVQLHAGDDTDIFMMEPAASFSAGGASLSGAVGAAVFVGETLAQVKDGASVTALGQTAMQTEIETTRTSSPLLDGIMGGDDNQTRDSLGSFNDDFTFDNVKDLFLTERRNTESRRGLAVTAVADQDVISIAASGAVSSDTAIAVSISAGVGVGRVEASIGDADINTINTGAHADQDVVVRAVSDTYWTDVSGAIAVGTGTAGVGIGGDVVVQVKDTRAFIARGADVTANDDVVVHAFNNDRIINSALSVGGGSTAGVSGAAAIGVTVNTTKAYIDGEVDAGDDLLVLAGAKSEHIQIAGGIGAGGTAGVGASFGIGFAKNDTQAFIDENAVTNAGDNTTVMADTTENAVSAVIAGGVGGTVGVSVSAGIKVHQSNTQAFIKGQVNQDNSSASASQSVDVVANNRINTIDVIGGVGGGGTVGVGVTLNALVVHNNAQAWIGGGANTRVSAAGDINVRASSDKTTKNFLLAGAAGGTVAVGGNIAVLMVGAESDDETAGQMNSDDHGDIAGASDERSTSIQLGDIANDDNSSGDYDRTGFNFAELNSAIDGNNAQHSQLGSTFDASNSGLSRNKTQAFIENGAIVRAGDDLTIEAEDSTNTVFAAAAVGGSGVATVGATVGVLLVNNTAEAYIDDNAVVNVEGDLLIRSRTSEIVGSGALSAGGAGVANVQGVVMAQKVTSKSRAFIDDATINDNTSEAGMQSVSVRAESDTELVSFSGSGGGAIVGVGITGDAMILEKQTTAYIDDNAIVRSGGDVDVSAQAQADLTQIAVSINGGVVGVTGAAGIVAVNNVTQARIGQNTTLFARDSINVQATDDTEIDGIVITGAGGAVGVSGSVGVYLVESQTNAIIDENAQIIAWGAGDGMDAINGEVDNSTTQTRTQNSRDQEGNLEQRNIETVDAAFGTQRIYGLNVAAVTNEDINFAPIGVAGGAVGVAGVVATTIANSTTQAVVRQGAVINGGDNSAAGANQSVAVLASSQSQLNNISAGVGVGGVGVTLDIDTQVFKKNVRAQMMGTAMTKQDIQVTAQSRDQLLQTATGIAGGATGAAGIVEVSVVANDVRAEIGDNATAFAGDDIAVQSVQDLSMIQTAGNVAAGAAGIGSSVGILIAKSSNIARIGDNARIHAFDDLQVVADSSTRLNQNIIGFAGGGTIGFTGSVGVNILKTTTIAEIGNQAQINQALRPNGADQTVRVEAVDNVTTQGAAGAAAIGGVAGVGIGVVATVTRNTTRATIGDGTSLSATDDITVLADSTKNISNQGIAFGGGLGIGAAGSVALTVVGGAMSDDGRATFDKQDEDGNSTGNLLGDAESAATSDRQQGDNSQHDGHDASGKSNQLYAQDYDTRANQLAENEATGLESDVTAGSGDTTRAAIGQNVRITTQADLIVRAEETLNLSQISGGAAIGSVGVGGFVAVADYGGAVTADIGDNTVIDNATNVTVDATLNSGQDIQIQMPDGQMATLPAVNSTVIGASVGIAGLSASVSQVNLAENVNATIGNNVSVNLQNDQSDVAVTALRDVNAGVKVAAVAGGVVAAGVSYAGINASGNARAAIGDQTRLGTNGQRAGDVLIQARNRSSQDGSAYSAGLAYGGAVVGAVVNVDDRGSTLAEIGNGSQIYASGQLLVHSDDQARNKADALGVAVAAGVGLSIISSHVDIDRDASIDIGDNVVLTAANIDLASKIGETGQLLAESDATGASGGLLVGATGSESMVTATADSHILIGQNSAINVHRLDGSGAQIAGDNLTITASNAAGLSNEINAFAFGAAAIGAHVARSNQLGDTLIDIGSGTAINVMGSANIQALSEKSALTDTIAGAGGLLAINGGEAVTNNITNTKIRFQDAANSNARTRVAVSDNLNLYATNNDNYDSRIDAAAIGAASVTGGLSDATGSADVRVRLGNHTEIDTHQLELITNNNLSKQGYNTPNFKFDGGGGLTVTLGYAQASQTQISKVEIGDGADIVIAGIMDNQGHGTIKALSQGVMDTEALVSTGGFVSIPQSLARNTQIQDTAISFGTNARLVTERGDLSVRTKANSNVVSRAKTSVWGLAGAGAEGRAYATANNDERITLANGANIIANGYMRLYAGSEVAPSDINVVAKTNIFNRTLVPITTAKIAEAALNRSVGLNVSSGASVKSARHMYLKALRGDLNVNGNGKHQFLVLGLPVDEDFGSAQTNASSSVTIDGTVETGVYNQQYVGFAKDFGNMVANSATADPTDVARQHLVYDSNSQTWERRSIDNASSLGQIDVATGSWSPNAGISVKSDDEIRWGFDQNRSLAQDIDDEITELQNALAASYTSSGKTRLEAKKANLENFKQGVLDGSITVEPAADNYNDALTGLNDGIAEMDTQIATLPADSSTWTPAQQTDFTAWSDNRTEMSDVRTELTTAGPNGFQPQDLVIAEINAQINTINNQILNEAPPDIKQAIDTEIAFLQAKKAMLNTAAVDVITVDGIFAATGHVDIESDNLYGGATGQITSKNQVRVNVRNSSSNPIELLDITIPDDPGGSIFFKDQIVQSHADIAHLNQQSGTVNMGLTSDPGNFDAQIIIESDYNTSAPAYNPDGLNIKNPELLLSGNIENRGGLVQITNKNGSIFQTATINAAQLKMTSGGSLFISDKNSNGISNLGAHPNAGFSEYVDPRERDPGFGTTGKSSLGGCNGINENALPCNVQSVANANQFTGDDFVIAGEKIFVVANTVNLNGLIQSGVSEKTITVSDFTNLTNDALFNVFQTHLDDDGDGIRDSNEWTDLNSNGVFDIADLANEDDMLMESDVDGSFSGSGLSRRVSGLYESYYSPADDVVYVTGLEAKAGEVFIGGKLISTGNGQINVMDGYGNYSVNNQSSKDLKIITANTGEVEGKVTLIDNFKVNNENLSLVTQFTRIGDNLVVKAGYGSPSTDVSGQYTALAVNGENDRRTSYNITDGARYHWMNGEYAAQEIDWRYQKTTFGFPGWDWFSSDGFRVSEGDMEPSQIAANDLPSADYATIDASITDDFRMTYRYEQHSYSNALTSRNKTCKGFILYKCWLTVEGTINDNGNHYYYYDVAADRPVDIVFTGSDAGQLNLSSNAGIVIDGSIHNPTGTTRLNAQGDIRIAGSGSVVNVGNLVINSTGSVGSIDQSLRLKQGQSDTIELTADGNIFVKSVEGSLNFAQLNNQGSGVVDLYAGQNITLTTNTGTALRGSDISLTAKYGSLSDVSGNAIQIDSQNDGVFSAYSRMGDIDIFEVAGDMRIGQIDGIADVSVGTQSGDILDGNFVQTDDVQTQAALLDLWNELQLTGQNAEDKKTAQIAVFETEMTSLYQDYWKLREVTEVAPGIYVAQDYDPNFAYSATAQEQAALNNDPMRVAEYEARQQARYQQGYEKFGDPAYNPNYSHVASTDEIDVMTAGYKWQEAELEVALPGAAFKEVTDTTAFIENPNIIGDDITLNARGGSIGQFDPSQTFTLADITSGNLDNASKIKLAAAEADDVQFDEDTGILTLTQREDLDIKTRLASSVVIINAADGHAFIGGENSDYGLNINTLAARDEVRLKINGDIINIRTDNAAALSGASAVIEAGAGAIGSGAQPFRIDIADGEKITARAFNGIWLEEKTNHMEVGQIYSPGTIQLVSPDSIIDFENDLIMDVKGQDVQLVALNSIGEAYLATDSSLVRKQKALDVASVNYDNSTFSVTSTNDGAWLYGPLRQNIRITAAQLNGDLDVAVGQNLKAQGSFDTNGNDIYFRSYENLQLDGDGGIQTNGAALNLIAGDNLTIVGSVATAGAALNTISGADTLVASNADITTSGGDLTMMADGLLNQNITIEDNGTDAGRIDTATGKIRLSASGDLSVTNLNSASTQDCTAGQTGCAVTLLANNIIDSGNSQADITINGSGGLRLGTHNYVNLDQIDYQRAGQFNLFVGGKNDGARGVAAMLGVHTDANVNLAYLSMNSAAIEAPRTATGIGTSSFSVTDGNIRDNLYLNLGAEGENTFFGRIGRLENNQLAPDQWLLAGAQTGYFDNGAVRPQTDRKDDYRCTGLPGYIGNANAIFNFSFSFSRPFIDCSGVLNYYSPAYSLVQVKQTADQQVLGGVASLVDSLNRQAAENRFSASLAVGASPNFVTSVATRATDSQFYDITNGFTGIIETPERRSLSQMIDEGLQYDIPENILDLTISDETPEIQVDDALILGGNGPVDADLSAEQQTANTL